MDIVIVVWIVAWIRYTTLLLGEVFCKASYHYVGYFGLYDLVATNGNSLIILAFSVRICSLIMPMKGKAIFFYAKSYILMRKCY